MSATIPIITPACPWCQQRSTVQVTPAELDRYRSGLEHVQDIWPHWTPDQRELLITGTHGECWDAMMGDEEE